MKVCLIAAPLMARSGVYRSTLDLVAAARRAGHEWSAIVALRPDAAGASVPAPGIHERVIHSHGRDVLTEIRDLVSSSPAANEADVVITMISQSDMAYASLPRRRGAVHVAWVRGLPWPDTGEQTLARRLLLRALEIRALRKADAVWATTPLLASQIRSAVTAEIVPAGIPLLPRVHSGASGDGDMVWAGRFAPDKGLPEFLDLARSTGHNARVHGAGPLEQSLRPGSPATVTWSGWVAPDHLWRNAALYVSTSHREAYGRCAVEAASAGLPVILSDQVGVAPFLFTDPELRSRFVLPLGDERAWRDAVRDLTGDRALRQRVSDHVSANAATMTIERSMAAAQRRLDALAHEQSSVNIVYV